MKQDYSYTIKTRRVDGTISIRNTLAPSNFTAIEMIKGLEGIDNIKTLTILHKQELLP